MNDEESEILRWWDEQEEANRAATLARQSWSQSLGFYLEWVSLMPEPQNNGSEQP